MINNDQLRVCDISVFLKIKKSNMKDKHSKFLFICGCLKCQIQNRIMVTNKLQRKRDKR